MTFLLELPLTLWLHLTGGEYGCPRLRFFISIAVAYGLYLALLQPFAYFLHQVMQPEALAALAPYGECALIAGLVAGALALLLAFLPLAPLALLGSAPLGYELYRLFQGKATPVVELPYPLWFSWAAFGFCSLALLGSASVVFGLAWRRLADAGRSPLLLLLGLTYLLGIGRDGLVADTIGAYLLGPLWLAILFCQRSRERKSFDIFRRTRA